MNVCISLIEAVLLALGCIEYDLHLLIQTVEKGVKAKPSKVLFG